LNAIKNQLKEEIEPEFADKHKWIKHFAEQVEPNRKLAREEIEDLLLKYEDEVQREKWNPKVIGHQNSPNNLFELKEDFMVEDLQNFKNLYSLMSYYYHYDVEKYKLIAKEYEERIADLFLKAAGLNINF
jgi:hypothetical protein